MLYERIIKESRKVKSTAIVCMFSSFQSRSKPTRMKYFLLLLLLFLMFVGEVIFNGIAYEVKKM